MWGHTQAQRASHRERGADLTIELHAAPLTCTLDGLAHVISADAAVAGITAGRGTYTALCGHTVYAAAMICSAGRPCPRCAQQLAASVAAPVAREPRSGFRARLKRLMRRSPAPSDRLKILP